MTQFWRIQCPEYESDYKASYINGSIEHPYGLPGVVCDVCGATWGGSRVLPCECPPQLRTHPNMLERWPVSRSEHAALQHELMAALGVDGEAFVDLRPGDALQPGFLDVPSRVRADFLWPGSGHLVVSDRVQRLLLKEAREEVIACPVELRRIGKRGAKLPPVIPSTGEPEDMINELPLLEDVAGVGPYFEIVILKESGFPPGSDPVSMCGGCKRLRHGRDRELRMTPEMWKGHAIFFLATTLHVVVTDAMKRAIESVRATNVVFRRV